MVIIIPMINVVCRSVEIIMTPIIMLVKLILRSVDLAVVIVGADPCSYGITLRFRINVEIIFEPIITKRVRFNRDIFVGKAQAVE